jgi:hypothetical protein
VLARKPGDHPEEHPEVRDEAQQDPQHAQQEDGPRLVVQPHEAEHVGGKPRGQPGDRERPGKRHAEPEEREEVEQQALRQRGRVGFEVLKQVMTFYLSSVTISPSGAVFGSLLGLLVFVNFVSRFTLFVTAWAATAKESEQEKPAPVPGPAVIRVTGLLGLRFLNRRGDGRG